MRPLNRREALLRALPIVVAASARASARSNSGDTSEERCVTPYKYGKLVLGPSGATGEFDSRSVDCPFLFSHRGLFYLAYVGWDGIGYQTGLASSTDLVKWKRLGCVLKRDPASEITKYNIAMNWMVRENGLRSPGKLMRINGRFLGVYHAYPNSGYESGPAVIGLCWSEDLMRWTVDPPILYPKDGADWERGGLYKPCLLKIGETFHFFYNAKSAEPRGWREQTGVATSQDLKTWARYSGNPIIPNGSPGSWDERFASDPCVVNDHGKWVFFYYGLDAKGKARDLLGIGDDPLHPRKVDRILIDVGQPGSRG